MSRQVMVSLEVAEGVNDRQVHEQLCTSVHEGRPAEGVLDVGEVQPVEADHGWICYNGGPGAWFWSANRQTLVHELSDSIRPATSLEKAMLNAMGNTTQHVQAHNQAAARTAAAFAAMQEFCDRVDKGEVRSRRTYARFKEILAMGAERRCTSTKSEDGGSCSPRVPCDGVIHADGTMTGGCAEPCAFVMDQG